jgi:hypothetical protein
MTAPVPSPGSSQSNYRGIDGVNSLGSVMPGGEESLTGKRPDPKQPLVRVARDTSGIVDKPPVTDAREGLGRPGLSALPMVPALAIMAGINLSQQQNLQHDIAAAQKKLVALGMPETELETKKGKAAALALASAMNPMYPWSPWEMGKDPESHEQRAVQRAAFAYENPETYNASLQWRGHPGDPTAAAAVNGSIPQNLYPWRILAAKEVEAPRPASAGDEDPKPIKLPPLPPPIPLHDPSNKDEAEVISDLQEGRIKYYEAVNRLIDIRRSAGEGAGPPPIRTTAASQFEHPFERALPEYIDQTFPSTGKDKFGLPVWDRRVVQNLQNIASLERQIARLTLGGNPPGGEIPAEYLEVIDRALTTLRTLGLGSDEAKRARPGIIAAFEQLGRPGRAFDLRADRTAEGYQFTVASMDPGVYRTNSEGKREYLIDALRVVSPSGTISDGFTGRRTAPLPDDPGADTLHGMTVAVIRQEIARLKRDTDSLYGPGTGNSPPPEGVRVPSQLTAFAGQVIPRLAEGKEAARLQEGLVKAAGQLDSRDPSGRFSFGARPEVSQLVVLRRDSRGIIGARIVTPTGAIFDGFTGRRTDIQ